MTVDEVLNHSGIHQIFKIRYFQNCEVKEITFANTIVGITEHVEFSADQLNILLRFGNEEITLITCIIEHMKPVMVLII